MCIKQIYCRIQYSSLYSKMLRKCSECQSQDDSNEDACTDSYQLYLQENLIGKSNQMHAYPTKHQVENLEEDDDDNLLRPKMKPKDKLAPPVKSQTLFRGTRSQLQQSTRLLKPSTAPTKKRMDPVALFQQTSQVWQKTKFLKSSANNKEGRKLALEKRNKLKARIL